MPVGTLRAIAFVAIAASACTANEAQVNTLDADQRAYFDAIRAADHRRSKEAALETARASRSLSAADLDAVIAAEATLTAVTPQLVDDGTNPDLVQIELAFDGTWDDRDKMTFDTNPALLVELFDGLKHYETGVGTTAATKLLGGVAGAGITHRINHAYDWLVGEINRLMHANPRTQVALIVTGFSRGSTAARAFVNVLNKRGVPDQSSAGATFEPPRIGAMILFDTVGSVGIPGTNLNPGLDLAIPANVENVLHLTARDEKRRMFPLSSARDPSRPDDARILELPLPGVHSDVGGSYPNRYSRIPLHMAYDYLHRAGIRVKWTGDVPDIHDPSLRLHLSGGDGVRIVYPSTNPRP